MAEGVRERPAAGMAWAVKAVTREPVYVGRLDPGRHVGLRCQCVCPACGAQLQAVNLQEPPESSRQPFFRHHVGTQGPGCKYRVAELAALKMLAEQGVIEIPAPRRLGTRVGISGTIYQAEAVGMAVRERIVERRLVSETAAFLTLESGKRVALVLRGHQDVGELGSVFAVVEVHVDDPEVAWMSPEEIVQQSELEARWLHVIGHEQDGELQEHADERARQRALEQLDVDPDELGLPVGATKKQASESLIHWAVKEAVMRTGWIQAPGLHLKASATGRDGSVHTVPVVLPPTRLWVETATAEVLFEGYRADIVCEVREEADEPEATFKLLIEVAVTNKVKAEKLRLIQQAGIACIELDVLRFTSGGAVTRSQLRELVARDVESKGWLHHPKASDLLDRAQQRANAARDADERRRSEAAEREAEQRRLAAEEARVERERQEAKAHWAARLGRESALLELQAALKQRWRGQPERTSNGMTWEPAELEKALEVHLPPGLVGSTVLARGGLVWRLASIVRSGKGSSKPLDVRAVLGVGEVSPAYGEQQWLGLLHLAIDEVGSLIEDGREAYEAQRRMVLGSLKAGERTYARPRDLDALLAEWFPELREMLSRDLGTRDFSERLRQEKDAERRRAEEQERLAEQEAMAERQRAAEAAAAERERKRLLGAIEDVAFQWTWKTNVAVPADPEAAVGYLKFSRFRETGERWTALVREGFSARQQGADFGSWFRTRSYSSADEVTAAREVLEAAWLVQNRIVDKVVRVTRKPHR